jgi:hypothetical protein
MSRGNYLLVVALLLATPSLAQHKSFRNSALDIMSVGIGIGFDHGGIGANALLYPNDNLGFFVGAGYALAGPAFNAGLKYRLTNYSSKYHPFFSAMYGHNALIATSNARDKLFYGTTLGVGIDVHPQWRYNYFSFSLLVPIKGSEMKEYLDNSNGHGLSYNSTSIPIGISVSYRFGIE